MTLGKCELDQMPQIRDQDGYIPPGRVPCPYCGVPGNVRVCYAKVADGVYSEQCRCGLCDERFQTIWKDGTIIEYKEWAFQ